MSDSHRQHVIVLLIGVIAAASAVILIRLSVSGPVQLSATRLVLAALVLSPLAVRELVRSPVSLGELFYRTWPGAVLLALHFVAWAAGARMTLAANASLVVNLVPIAMPFMLMVVSHERVGRREVVGTVIALGGVALLCVPEARFDVSTLGGDLMCLLAMLLATAYLIAGKLQRGPLALWSYLVPLYAMAGALCWGGALVVHLMGLPGQALVMPDIREALILAGLALIPTVIGHSALNSAMKHLRPQVVAVLNMGQFVFAGVLAYLLFRELPAVRFYPSAALVLVGGAVCLGLIGPMRAGRAMNVPADGRSRG